MRKVIDTLLAAAGGGKAEGGQPLELAEALDPEAYFSDTTCVKLHIAFRWIGCYCGTRRAHWHWRETDLKEGEARQIVQRIAMVLERQGGGGG